MGDSHRFNLFAEVVARNILHNGLIADVAGGKGYLQMALRDRGFANVETWDKRTRKAPKLVYRHQYFDWQTAPEYSAVVGMHPDEGSDHIIMYAGRHRVPAIICPCCVKPSAVAFWGRHTYHGWLKHLTKLAEEQKLQVIFTHLKMRGRNDVMILRP